MRNSIFISFLIALSTTIAYGQTRISGTVVDGANNEPIENCNVYISGSSKGQFTDSNGKFEIKNLENGIYELVFSHVNYKTHVQVIEAEGKEITIKAGLIENPISLASVVVVSEQDKTLRRKTIKEFKDFFFGKGYNESQIAILNEEDIILEKQENGFLASNKPYTLRIENDHLGYNLEYYIKEFILSNKTNLVLGYPKFSEQKAFTPSQKLFWLENRQRAYNGSIRHFFLSLLDKNLEEEGFEAFLSTIDPEAEENIDVADYYDSQNNGLVKLDPNNLPVTFSIEETKFNNLMKINFGGTLVVNYKNEFSSSGGTQFSQLKMNEDYIFVYKNGVILNPSAIKTFGEWAGEGTYHLLPVDYESNDSIKIDDSKERRKLLSQLSNFTQSHPVEKIYIHTNRSEFYPKETLWFKAYVVAGPLHQPSPLSHNIRVDLINPQNEITESILLSSNNGIAEGSFNLGKDLAGGKYTLRAYTTAMESMSTDFFFKKTIIIDPPIKKLPIESSKDLDLQFFPESGHLINGLITNVAFKAIDQNGMPVSIKGKIVNQNGTDVAYFKSEHNGMGVFQFSPKSGDLYNAQTIDQNGNVKSYTFPKVETKGTIFHVDTNSSDNEVLVRFKSNTQDSDMFIICQSRGWLTYTNSLNFKNGADSLSIPKSTFMPGINQITLFNKKGTPIAQRLFFIYPMEGLELKIEPDQASYQTREKTSLKILLKDKNGTPLEGNFSLTALNKDRIYNKSINDNIVSNLLLNSDIKGYVHHPAYYFENVSQLKKHQLDLVMMTNGWSRFTWEQIEEFSPDKTEINYAKRMDIHGNMVYKSNEKPVKRGTVTYINNESKNPETIVTETDRNGNFTIENAMPYKDMFFMIRGADSRSNKEIQINIDSTLNLPNINPGFQEIFFKERELEKLETSTPSIPNANQDFLSQMYFGDSVRILESVSVEAMSEITQKKSLYGQPSFTFDLTELVKNQNKSNIFQSLQGRLPGVNISHSNFGKGNAVLIQIRKQTSTPPTFLTNGDGPIGSVIDVIPSEDQPLFFLDNVQVDLDALLNLPMEMFERIEVFKGPDAAIFGSNASQGAMLFFTKTGYRAFSKTENGVFPFSLPTAYHVSQEFYAPKYEFNQNSPMPDHRISLHWEPNIVTNKSGEAIVSYFNSDDLDTIQVIVEGLTSGGKPVVGTIEYTVTNKQEQ